MEENIFARYSSRNAKEESNRWPRHTPHDDVYESVASKCNDRVTSRWLHNEARR